MQNRFNVVITDVMTDALDPEKSVLSGLADVTSIGAVSEADLAGVVEDADAIMMYHSITMSRATIERLTRCRLIVRCGVGFDNVDHAFARCRGIPVSNVPDYGTEEVADSAIGLMLSLTRGINMLNSGLRAGLLPWDHSGVAPLRRLRARQLGIVGLGRIGTATAVRAKALGVKVAFYDPYKQDGYDKALGLHRFSTLEEMLGESYAVSMHCPLNSDTRHMINARTLEFLPPGSYLINTARGLVVDTAAIPDAIRSGRLAGAAIDVLEKEPPPADDPLIAAWRDPAHPAHHRVIVNSHSAFYSEEGLMEMRMKGAEACRRALLNLPLRNVVNLPATGC